MNTSVQCMERFWLLHAHSNQEGMSHVPLQWVESELRELWRPDGEIDWESEVVFGQGGGRLYIQMFCQWTISRAVDSSASDGPDSPHACPACLWQTLSSQYRLWVCSVCVCVSSSLLSELRIANWKPECTKNKLMTRQKIPPRRGSLPVPWEGLWVKFWSD